jgi:flagellar P-ring protein FlgI
MDTQAPKQIVLSTIVLTVFALAVSLLPSAACAKARVKDIASVAGVRENFLMGCGLVTGLSGTGDNLRNSIFTREELASMLEKLGITIHGANLKTKNVAAVMVVSSLPSFAKPGSKIDVKVSALGDASSLANGVLLPVPLFGPDGIAYAIAQGAVSTQSFIPNSAEVRSKQAEVLTSGSIAHGAIVERDMGFSIQESSSVHILLNSPDFATAKTVEDAINDSIPGNLASAVDSSSIRILIPKDRRSDIVSLIAEIESIEVDTDCRAIVAINEVTGTVVVGAKVKVKPVAVAHGNLVVEIGGPPKQPRKKKMQESIDRARGEGMQNVEDCTTLGELVSAVNRLGVLPKDLIDIIKCIRAAGALDAVIEVR